MDDDKIFLCMVKDCCESWTISVHKTRAGAYRAGRNWLLSRFNESYESRALIGKSPEDFRTRFCSFSVKQSKLLD